MTDLPDNNIYNLSPAEFRATIEQMQREGRDVGYLREGYRRQNSAFGGMYGAIDNVRADGRTHANILPMSKPNGMTGGEAWRAGELRLDWPNWLMGGAETAAQAVETPGQLLQGVPYSQDEIQTNAFNLAGALQLGGGAMATAPRGALRAGLARAETTPSQAVADMLRAGRAADVTDDMMAQVDPQEMWRMYESGATGADMPMDAASRMARAEGMGFDTGTPLYRGSNHDPQRFIEDYFQSRLKDDEGIFMTTSPDNASGYGSGVMPLLKRPESPTEINMADFDDVLSHIPEDRRPWGGTVEDLAGAYDPGDILMRDEFADVWKDFQPNDVVFKNMQERRNTPDTHDIHQTFDPVNIRGRFARFDPRLSHLANLNAANVSPLAGMVAMGPSEDDKRTLGQYLQGLRP